MSNPEDYAVGWICAISTEYVAAQSLLDERHGTPSSVSRHDNNDYTLGKIGEHNVVIAVLPDGEYGIASAASVARDMLHSFPNVRIGLMVGIGGGAPSEKHDIRLGDVVVSAPREGMGGVFQYDFGKTIQNQSFRTTGFLNQPPMVLRTAMAGLRAQYESEGHEFEATICDVLNKKPRLRKKFSRPAPTSDRLYRSKIVHPIDTHDGCEVACGNDAKKLVSRREREEDEDNPAIHYGLIASANQLMKDAIMRDALAAEMGVLCFEMEAAGLMNQFPCLVIRGICDYSDSHKNKEWQGYAAMTAAAYAKDLLYRIPPNKVEAEQKIKDALAHVVSTIDDMKNDWDSIKDIEILDWVTSHNYGPRHSDFFNRRQPGTGQWLLRSAEYRTWLTESNKTLFCVGIPGSGKTILTAIVIEDLRNRTFHDANTGLAYIYCNFKRQHEQGIEDLIASLVKQLSRKKPCLPDVIRKLHQKHEKEKTRPSLDELVEALRLIATMYSKVIVVIDALDECVTFSRSRSRLLSYISGLRTRASVSLFATSRHIPDIDKEFEGSLRREVLASEEDLHQYLDVHMEHLPSFLSDMDDLKQEIEVEVIRAAQGMFLLAHLSLESLKGTTSVSEVRATLKRLTNRKQAGNGQYGLQYTLKQAYDEAMDRIKDQSDDQRRLAKSALEWICCAKRPLTPLELRHALAVRPEENTVFDADTLREVATIISVCAGLITVDEESNIVRLVHYTTQEYFDRRQNHLFPNAETKIAAFCCKYLSNISWTGDDGRFKWSEAVRLSNPLFDYAGKNWGHHVRLMPDIPRNVQDFMTCPTTIEAAALALPHNRSIPHNSSAYIHRGQRRRKWNGLHLAAFFGICQAVEFIPHKKKDLNSRDTEGMTPLVYAVRNRHQEMARLLIEKGAAVATKNEYDRTPLSYAIKNHDESMIRFLLGAGADFQMKAEILSYEILHSTEGIMRLCLEKCPRGNPDGLWARLLDDAVRGGHEDYLRLLLKKGNNYFSSFLDTLENVDGESSSGHWGDAHAVVDVAFEQEFWIDLEERDRERLLFLAARNGRTNTVRLLLEQGVSIHSRHKSGKTALSYAACRGNVSIIRLLLAKGLAIEAKDEDGQTPLSVAACSDKDCMAAIDLLLDRGADVDARDKNGQTALMKVAHVSRVRLLLDRGAMIEAADNWGRTALMHAISNFREHVVKELLDGGAMTEARDNDGNTALLLLYERRGVLDPGDNILLDLLECDASINAKDCSGETMLMKVAACGKRSSVELLLGQGAMVGLRDNLGQTALHHATANWRGHAVEVLLAAGADIEAKDNLGKTALHHAAHWTLDVNLSLLLDEGADIQARDNLGQTALMHAAHRGIRTCIAMLLDRGADIEARDHDGRSALYHAVTSTWDPLGAVDMLLNRGAALNARALACAIRHRNMSVILRLVWARWETALRSFLVNFLTRI